CRRRRFLDKVDLLRPSTQGFYSNCTGSGEQINPHRSHECLRIARSQYIKKRLAQTVRGRPDVHSTKRAQGPATKLSGNDSHRMNCAPNRTQPTTGHLTV